MRGGLSTSPQESGPVVSGFQVGLSVCPGLCLSRRSLPLTHSWGGLTFSTSLPCLEASTDPYLPLTHHLLLMASQEENWEMGVQDNLERTWSLLKTI